MEIKKRVFPTVNYEANLILFDNQIKIASFDANKRTINLYFKNIPANIVFTVDDTRVKPIVGSDKISVNLYMPHTYSVLFIDGKNQKKSAIMSGLELIGYINQYNNLDYYNQTKSSLFQDLKNERQNNHSQSN